MRIREAGSGESVGGLKSPRVGRRAWVGYLLVATVFLLVSLCSSASAISQRGHEFKGVTLGEPGTGDGQFNDPTAIAVNEKTGDIYVVDSGNNRIERFNSKHEFISAWGWGVAAKEAEKKKAGFQICTSECHPGYGGHASGQFHSAASIAVDNSGSEADPSAGDVYVEAVTPYTEGEKEFEFGVVYKFTATGEVGGKPTILDEFKAFKGEKIEAPNGVAVSPTGDLWIYNEEEFVHYDDAVENNLLSVVRSESEGEGRPGFAFDAKAGPLGGLLAVHGFGANSATAVTAKDTLLDEENPSGEVELLAVPVTEALDAENTTGVASDSKTGDAYVDHGSDIAAFDTAGHAIQTFGAGEIGAGHGLAADAASEQVLVADSNAGRIEFFELEEPGAPTIDELSAVGTTATTTTLNGLIDPSGNVTSYAFRYSTGAVPKASEPCASPCVQVPVGAEQISAVFGDVLVEAQLKDLTPSSVYHYRLWAENKSGGSAHLVEYELEGSPAELTFKTQPAVFGETLPDGRTWELVSPPDKGGAAIQGMTNEGGLSEASEDGSKITYVTEGAIAGGEPVEGNRAPEVSQILSSRSSAGWSTSDIDTKHNEAEGITPGSGGEYHAFSGDLSLALVQPFGSSLFELPPLSKEASERTPYLRHDETCGTTPSSCFQPLVTPANVAAGTTFGSRLAFVAGSPDLSHIALTSTAALTTEATVKGQNLFEWSGGALRLIDVLPGGKSAPASAIGFQNGDISMVRHAISSNGSRYVWSAYKLTAAGSERPQQLYLRDMGQPESIPLAAKEEGVAEAPGQCTETPEQCEHPIFQTASEDDSIVFFTDEQRLTSDSGASYEKPDLYACEVEEKEVEVEGQIKDELAGCKITDLTPSGGNVQGNVLGASEDGSIVYFVGNGALGGAGAGSCRKGEVESNKELHEAATEAQPIGTECNLYVEHRAGVDRWSPPQLVQRLSGEDERDWGSGTFPGALGKQVSRVSPNGNWLAFMSERSLTDYNTRDRTSDRGAEEVYLYDAATGKTVCASCNPTGARPEAILDREFAGEGIGLLVDRPLLWTKRRLAANIPSYTRVELNNAFYQSRFLSNEGRLYFDSAEGLVPQDKNGKEDAYQYEPSGIASGGCVEGSETFVAGAEGCVSLISSGESPKESAFLDASNSGDDVFFITAQALTANDQDTSYDVYDATICGTAGRPECLQPPQASKPPCESTEECRPGATGVPVFGSSLSEGPSAGGNVSPQHEVLSEKVVVNKPAAKPKPLTRAQKLQKALRACKKLKKHSKRAACERTAHKNYGPLKKAKKSAAVHGASVRGR
jgi:DNA-binding beta-propeller fold protein YncE